MGVLVMGFLFAVAPPAAFVASSPAPSLPTLSHSSHSFSRLGNNSFSLNSKSASGFSLISPYVRNERYPLIAKASSEGSSSDRPVPPSDSEEDSVPVENLPLESKLQLKLEQKMRMKLAKKIRLRRKKLVRKRRLRKRGRWPPSKLKKNKNV